MHQPSRMACGVSSHHSRPTRIGGYCTDSVMAHPHGVMHACMHVRLQRDRETVRSHGPSGLDSCLEREDGSLRTLAAAKAGTASYCIRSRGAGLPRFFCVRGGCVHMPVLCTRCGMAEKVRCAVARAAAEPRPRAWERARPFSVPVCLRALEWDQGKPRASRHTHTHHASRLPLRSTLRLSPCCCVLRGGHRRCHCSALRAARCAWARRVPCCRPRRSRPRSSARRQVRRRCPPSRKP